MDTVQIIVSSALSVGIAWGIMRQKLADSVDKIKSIELRIQTLELKVENYQMQTAVRLERIEVTMSNVASRVQEIWTLMRERNETRLRETA